MCVLFLKKIEIKNLVTLPFLLKLPFSCSRVSLKTPPKPDKVQEREQTNDIIGNLLRLHPSFYWKLAAFGRIFQTK